MLNLNYCIIVMKKSSDLGTDNEVVTIQGSLDNVYK